jgi:hypothetical protein
MKKPREKVLSILAMGSARELAYTLWGVYEKLLSSLICEAVRF